MPIDYFATGYSSLAYLNRIPPAPPKSIAPARTELPHDMEEVALRRAVLALGHRGVVEVVAEGVEPEEQLASLRGMGCDRVQGYLLGRPNDAQVSDDRFSPPAQAGGGVRRLRFPSRPRLYWSRSE